MKRKQDRFKIKILYRALLLNEELGPIRRAVNHGVADADGGVIAV